MINWQEIDTIFFDMDGTLLDLHFDNHFWLEAIPQFYAEKNNLNLEQAKKIIQEKTQNKLGSLDWYCTDYWSKVLDLNIIKLKNHTAHKVKLRPNVLELLQFLSNKKCVLVTNAHPNTLEFKLCQVELAPFFKRLISSHHLKLAKEAPEFWDKFQTIEPFDKTRTLFIDDSLAVLQTAKAYGFTHLLGISRPDLSANKIKLDGFRMIDDFSDLIPR